MLQKGNGKERRTRHRERVEEGWERGRNLPGFARLPTHEILIGNNAYSQIHNRESAHGKAMRQKMVK